MAYPDTAVSHNEDYHSVDERLGFPRKGWYAECVGQELAEETKVGLAIECGVGGQYWSRPKLFPIKLSSDLGRKNDGVKKLPIRLLKKSYMVCKFWTWNRARGPLGALEMCM